MGIIFIFIGGAIGALFRYLILEMFKDFPYNIIGIFIANMLGCFLIGFIAYLAVKRNNIIGIELKKFFTVGIAGGLTTFSTFAYDIFQLFISQHYMIALLNIFFSVILGLIFVSWGMNSGYYVLNYFLQKKRMNLRLEKEC
ncbi:MAG: fluoride efflux transporter CrcB [Candidatus Gastranaerophilales bacterium]|nr:fluoride efflux transporter CrcB [Candidatus Gastranaerophilales bacterium]